MPIFYKNERRIYFAHIPKTAGSSIYYWFADNGWSMTNFANIKRGTRRGLLDQYPNQILENEHPHPDSPPMQHATADIFSAWGPFDTVFMITREPIARYKSELKFAFPRFARRWGLDKNSQSDFATYCQKHLKLFQSRIKNNPSFQDNHLRPQADFWADGAELFQFEHDWQNQIAKRFDLKGDAPRVNLSKKRVAFEVSLSNEDRAWLQEFYEVDYATFNYQRS